MKRLSLLKTLICYLMVIFIFSTVSCSSILSGLSDSLYQQNDMQLVREGASSYLLLVEGLIYANPDNKTFLQTGIQLFSAYSNAFVEDPERKKIFSDKSKTWALQLLRTYPQFRKVVNERFDVYKNWTSSIKKRDIPYIFWAANAWILWIIENADSPDAMLQLPKAKAIIDRIYEIDSSYYYGAPHLFYGIYYSFMPESIGGDLGKAKAEFDQALKYSGDAFFMTKVSYAEFYCKAKYDRDCFVETLQSVINTDLDEYPQLRLLNNFAQKRAGILLESVDEYFYEGDFSDDWE